MTIKEFFLMIPLAACFGAVGAYLVLETHDTPAAEATNPTANQSSAERRQQQTSDPFHRVLESGTLRCGYYVFPPVTYRDPNTGDLSGLSVDMMNTIGEKASLNIEWTEEVTFGNWGATLEADRVDAICTPMWPEVAMSRVVLFTSPMWYAGISPLVKADDPRFENATLETFNDPQITIVTQEGNATDYLARQRFPKANIESISAVSDGAQMLQEILSGKADVMLTDKNATIEYNKNSETSFRLIDINNPIKYQPFELAVGINAPRLRDFLSNAIDDLINTGTMDALLNKWENTHGTYMRIQPNASYPDAASTQTK